MLAGAVKVEIVERPDGSAELVGDAFYCVMMFARARRRVRPTLEALVDELLRVVPAVRPALASDPRQPAAGQLLLFLADPPPAPLALGTLPALVAA